MRRKKKLLRKWEWIEKACRELELTEPASLASEIDRVLLRLYGDEHTKEWEHDFDDIVKRFNEEMEFSKIVAMKYILEVANYAIYCIACDRTDRYCKLCEFGKVAGECTNDVNSLYWRFTSSMYASLCSM